MARNPERAARWSQPSAWVVLIGGALTIFFLVAIIREIVRTTTVRRQVERLQQELAAETRRQGELDDLIGYLSSPTFQEREARLRLGLKKSGERVIVIPSNESANASAAEGDDPNNPQAASRRPPSQWWRYFFGPQSS